MLAGVKVNTLYAQWARKSPSFLTLGPGFGAGARGPVDIVARETIATTQLDRYGRKASFGGTSRTP